MILKIDCTLFLKCRYQLFSGFALKTALHSFRKVSGAFVIVFRIAVKIGIGRLDVAGVLGNCFLPVRTGLFAFFRSIAIFKKKRTKRRSVISIMLLLIYLFFL